MKRYSILMAICIAAMVTSSIGIVKGVARHIHPQYERPATVAPYTLSTTTTTNDPANAVEGETIGTLNCDAIDLHVNLSYGISQSICDKENTALIFAPLDDEPLPLQLNEYAFIADHNYQSFWQLQYIKTGDELLLDSPSYGQFIYKVEKIEVWNQNDEQTDFYNDDGESLRVWCANTGKQGVVLYTCYPFDAWGNTTQRFVVFCDLVSSTKLLNPR